MSTELLYTSAPQGLRHGSRGFCTVLTTAGMPINVIAKLESISSYRHLFKPGSPQETQNPVALSHQRVNLGGQTVSVLSRIAAYGTDYSRRTNKLAHHITIDHAEMPAAGPAWLLRQKNLLRSDWLGQCETPPVGPKIPRGDQIPRICSVWKSVAGDAGWGGVVAEAIASGDAQPLWIVYPLRHQHSLIELMDESISLLPIGQRWDATFSTFAANIPPDVECKIRFVPVGTDEARFAASQSGVIDLTKHQSITTASNWVERARGVIRGETTPIVSSGSGSFTAVQDNFDVEPVQSSWSSDDDVPPGPPIPEAPPEIPPELLQTSGKRKLIIIASSIAAALLILLGTWTVARKIAGKPFWPGSETAKTDYVPPPVTPPPAPTPKVVRQVQPLSTQDFVMHYDQKQILAWALEEPDADSPFPTPIVFRGGMRIPPVETKVTTSGQDSQPTVAATDTTEETDDEDSAKDEDPSGETIERSSPETEAALVAWSSEAQSLIEAESLRVMTSKLTEGSQTVLVERLPRIPEALGTTKVYFSRDNSYLIAQADVDWNTSTSVLGDQRQAFRAFVLALSKITTLCNSINTESKRLPQGFQNLTDQSPFLGRSRRGDEAMIRFLIRMVSSEASIASEAQQLGQKLQTKQATLPSQLKKEQSTALLQIVADCLQLSQSAAELRRSYDVLKLGHFIEVPEMEFLSSDGDSLRSVPIRFHFSW